MKKTNTPNTAEMSLSSILSISKDMGDLAVLDELEKKIAIEKERSYKEGLDKGSKESYAAKEKFDNLAILAQNILIGTVVVAVIGTIYYIGHVANAKLADLDAKEIAGCSSGDYHLCIEGWERVVETSPVSNSDPQRAFSYEQAYFHATGQYLISDENKRYLGKK